MDCRDAAGLVDCGDAGVSLGWWTAGMLGLAWIGGLQDAGVSLGWWTAVSLAWWTAGMLVFLCTLPQI